MNISEVKKNISSLPAQDQAEISLWMIQHLDEKLDNENDVDAAWRKEIRTRVGDIQNGTVAMIPAKEMWQE